MAGKALDTGKSFVQQLAEKLPEGKRAVFLTTFDGEDAALQTIGDGVLGRSEFSRAMSEIQRVEAEQRQWWDKHRPLAELGSKAKDAGWSPDSSSDGNPDPTRDGRTSTLTEEDLNKRLDEREMGAAAFFAELQGLSLSHFRTFGEVLDAQAIRELTTQAARDPQGRGLRGAYETRFASQLSEKRKALADEEFDRRYKERFAEDVKKLGLSRPPDTIVGGLDQVSPLDALTKPTTVGADVQEMVDMYHDLAAKTGARA